MKVISRITNFIANYHERSRQIQNFGFLPRVQQSAVGVISSSKRKNFNDGGGPAPGVDKSCAAATVVDERISKMEMDLYVGDNRSVVSMYVTEL